MAVTFTRRRSNESSQRGRGALSRVIEWEAGPASTATEVEQSPSIPVQLNDAHPDDPGSNARVATIAVSRRERANHWIVRATWDNPADSSDDSSEVDPENPLAAPLRFEWSLSTNGEAIDRDVSGNPIVNSSGFAFDSSPQRDFTAPVLTVIRNVASFDISTALAYVNSVNSGTWRGAQPGEARCLSILPASVYTDNSTYVELRHQFEYRPIGVWGAKPHQLRIRDQGNTAYASVDGAVREVALYDGLGDRMYDVLLNGNGIPISSGITHLDFATEQPVAAPSFVRGSVPTGAELEDTGDAVFLRYDRYPERDFNLLGV